MLQRNPMDARIIRSDAKHALAKLPQCSGMGLPHDASTRAHRLACKHKPRVLRVRADAEEAVDELIQVVIRQVCQGCQTKFYDEATREII